MATKKLGIDQITVDTGLQARLHLSEEAIDEYAGIYRSDNGKAALPAIRVVYDKSTDRYLLVDGFHRFHAAHRAKVPKLTCEIEYGNWHFALLEACGANNDHGVRRTNEDKRKAVRMVLQDEKFKGQTDNWIATRCHVSNHLVSDVRKSVQPGEFQVEHAPKLDSKDGKKRPASKESAAAQRETVAAAVSEKPDATVREIAEETGASVGTVQAVKASPLPTERPFNQTHGGKWRQHFGGLTRMVDEAKNAGHINQNDQRNLQAILSDFCDRWEGSTGMEWATT